MIIECVLCLTLRSSSKSCLATRLESLLIYERLRWCLKCLFVWWVILIKLVLIKSTILTPIIILKWIAKVIVRMLRLKMKIVLCVWLISDGCSSHTKTTKKFSFHLLEERERIHMHSTKSKWLLIIKLEMMLRSSTLVVRFLVIIILILLV